MRSFFSDKKRTIAFFLAVIMFFALMSAVCIIGVEADHDCTGEDCIICLQISLCSSILKSFGLLSLFICGAFIVRIYKIESNQFLSNNTERNTLVSLNVKISA